MNVVAAFYFTLISQLNFTLVKCKVFQFTLQSITIIYNKNES